MELKMSETKYVYQPWCEWDIGQEGKVFMEDTNAYIWLETKFAEWVQNEDDDKMTLEEFMNDYSGINILEVHDAY